MLLFAFVAKSDDHSEGQLANKLAARKAGIKQIPPSIVPRAKKAYRCTRNTHMYQNIHKMYRYESLEGFFKRLLRLIIQARKDISAKEAWK